MIGRQSDRAVYEAMPAESPLLDNLGLRHDVVPATHA